MIEYEYGVHCGDKDCYSCGTQRYACKELDRLDTIEDRKEHESMEEEHEAVSRYESGDTVPNRY